jgi:hypothetical protein
MDLLRNSGGDTLVKVTRRSGPRQYPVDPQRLFQRD